MNSQDHLSRSYNAEMSALHSKLLAMGALVEDQVRLAIEALLARDTELASRVVQRDDEVDAYEIDIDDDCAHIIAKRQPTASDLRMVLGTSKIVMDLERIGDKARKIARHVKRLGDAPRVDPLWIDRVSQLAAQVRALLARAMKAFNDGDGGDAVEIMRANTELGRESQRIAGDVMRALEADPSDLKPRLDMLTVTRSIDRIADHAGNIAEHLVYITRGKDVRHATIAEIERDEEE